MQKKAIKANLHARNIHRLGYDFKTLVEAYPPLRNFVFENVYQSETIDFSHSEAVKALNLALLMTYYGIRYWDIPENYLCPPIPSRADYIHHLADLLALGNGGLIPEGKQIRGLDIGIGANGIYPIIGSLVYDWHFVGVDIDAKALENCKKIIENNPQLADNISLRQQTEPRFIFRNIIQPTDEFAFTICNPPFHSSKEEAEKGTLRKIRNLSGHKKAEIALNFGGQKNELWCEGGELGFITRMILESVYFQNQCLWFTTLVSKKDNLSSIYRLLKKVKASHIKTIEMAQGQKISRIVAWTFRDEKNV